MIYLKETKVGDKFYGRSSELAQLLFAFEVSNIRIVLMRESFIHSGRSELISKCFRNKGNCIIRILSAHRLPDFVHSIKSFSHNLGLPITKIIKKKERELSMSEMLDNLYIELKTRFDKHKWVVYIDLNDELVGFKDILKQFLSFSNTFLIIKTGRRSTFDFEKVGLSPKNYDEFLMSRLQSLVDFDSDFVKNITQDFISEPVAAKLAVAYIRQREEIVVKPHVTKPCQFDEDQSEDEVDISSSMLYLWKETIYTVKCSNKVAYKLLEFLAYFQPDTGISTTFIFSFMEESENKLKAGIRLLMFYSLITINCEHNISVKRIVQIAFRNVCNIHSPKLAVISRFWDKIEIEEIQKENIPALLSIWKHTTGDLCSLEKYGWKIFEIIPLLGLHDKISFVEENYNLLPGDKSPLISFIKAYLARKLGHFEEFLTKSAISLRDIFEQLGKSHKITNKVVAIIIEKETWENLSKAYQQVRELLGDIFGTDHIHLVNLQYNLAAVEFDRGNYQDAKLHWEQVLHWRLNEFGENYENTIITEFNIANCWLYQRNVREADEMYRKITAKCVNVFGEGHWITDEIIRKQQWGFMLTK